MKNSWSNILIFISLFIFVIPLIPVFSDGIFSGHDIMIHLIYLRKFTEAISQGQFPVRIIDWLTPGLDHPVFNFYQPFFYYLFQIPHFLGFSNTSSLTFTASSLWLLSGIFMYLFSKRHFGTLGGIISASFYILAPYHISDLFVRAALPEFTALAFVPGIFWAVKAFYDEKRGFYLFSASIFTAFLAVSHSPTLIMFAPLIALYIFYLYFIRKWESASNFEQKKNTKYLFYQILSIFVGIGISSFFLIPAFFEQKFIQPVFLKSGYYNFHNHFVCLPQLFTPNWGYGVSTPDCNDGMSFQLGIAHWVVVLATIIFISSSKFQKTPRNAGSAENLSVRKSDISGYLSSRTRESEFSGIRILFLTFVFIPLFMTLAFSQSIWESIDYLAFIQYPWRFLSVAVFASSFLAGSIIVSFKKDLYKNLTYIGLIALVFISYVWYLHPQQYLKEEQTGFDSSSDFLKNENPASHLPELGYMPKWTYANPGKDMPKDGVKIKGTAAVKALGLNPTRKEYLVEANSTSRVLFYIHYFPGWKTYLDGKEVEPRYDNVYGYMELKIPEGNHDVTFSFENTTVRTAGNWLSILALISSLSFFLVGIKRKSSRT